MLADLSFADFLLWVPPATTDEARPAEFLCVAQAGRPRRRRRTPTTWSAARSTAADHPQLRRALVEGRICREEDPRWHLGRAGAPGDDPGALRAATSIAVLSRDTNLAVPRVPSPLEIAYLGSAADLCQMVADGTFPAAEPVGGRCTPARAWATA